MRSTLSGFLISLVAGCAPSLNEPAQPLATASTLAATPTAYTLGVGPAVPGERMEFTLSGLPRGKTAYFLGGTLGEGPGPCHPTLPVCLDILGPATILGSAKANAAGVAKLSMTVPPILRPGFEMWVQGIGIDGANSATTQVVYRIVGDADQDGLYDADEALLGTDPYNPDTDGDGLTDSAEVAAGTNPLVAWTTACESDGDPNTTSLNECMPTVSVPSGWYEMGCRVGRDDLRTGSCPGDGTDGPVSGVIITRPFEITTTEVTRRAWAALESNDPSFVSTDPSAPACTDDCPVDQVSFWDALHLANAASAVAGLPSCYTLTDCTGTPGVDLTCDELPAVNTPSGSPVDCVGFRLPTEAEWEYAARADRYQPYPGSDNPDDVAWFNQAGPTTVCSKDTNDWGLCDLSGNVLEWVWDYNTPYNLFVTPGIPGRDPIAPVYGTAHGLRGGSAPQDRWGVRVAARAGADPGTRDPFVGIRLVRTTVDSDRDRMSDEAEAAIGSDPRDQDSDDDGLLDGDEVYKYGTNPNLADSDGDGIADPVERSNGTDPNTPFATHCTAGEIYKLGDLDGMRCVPAATFEMGCAAGRDDNPSCEANETPLHEVTLTSSVWFSSTELTQLTWLDLIGNNPSAVDTCGSPDTEPCTAPVEQVSWYDALAVANAMSTFYNLPVCYDLGTCSGDVGGGMFCGEIGVNTDSGSPYDCLGFRLPTEAEWEHAARGGEGFPYAGSSTADAVARTIENASGEKGLPCGFDVNGFDLCDMSGNVAEWTWDAYAAYGSAPTVNPVGPATSSWQVTRGGSYDLPASWSRVAHRRPESADEYLADLGLRLVRTFQPDRDGDGLDDILEKALGRDPLINGQ